jgi:DNA-binding XRE family transcriptional regulator
MSTTLDDVNAALDILDALPEQVRAEAERRAIPQAQVAEEALVSRFDLSRWLNGRVQPSTTTCRRLAAWLDTSRTHAEVTP